MAKPVGGGSLGFYTASPEKKVTACCSWYTNNCSRQAWPVRILAQEVRRLRPHNTGAASSASLVPPSAVVQLDDECHAGGALSLPGCRLAKDSSRFMRWTGDFASRRIRPSHVTRAWRVARAAGALGFVHRAGGHAIPLGLDATEFWRYSLGPLGARRT